MVNKEYIILTSVSVCLSVCECVGPRAYKYQEPHIQLHQIFYAAYGRG